jgi:hypothetical protein
VARSTAAGVAAARAGRALRRPQNWLELLKFCLVGASGYAINLAVYIALVKARTSTTSRRRCAPSSSP